MLVTLSRACSAHCSGGDGHIVPVAGRPLGAIVAAQVLVYSSHLVTGRVVRHLQGRVRLRATHIHRFQQVLAVHHSYLSEGKAHFY